MIEFGKLAKCLQIDSDGDSEYDGDDLTLPPMRFEKLVINGEVFDLRRPHHALEALERTEDFRKALNDGELDEYEDKPTEIWGGGRSRLRYDQLRAKVACDFHNGEHTMTWEQQNDEVHRIQEILIAQMKAREIP